MITQVLLSQNGNTGTIHSYYTLMLLTKNCNTDIGNTRRMVTLVLLYLTHVLLYKSNKTIGMFYGIFPDEENNPVDNLKICNVEGDNRLPPGLQPLTTESALKPLFNPVP